MALARYLKKDVHEEVDAMITKMEVNDPMRAGRYKEWRMANAVSGQDLETKN
jgi:hypothetical protein